jgi:tetratricopeptide (TPR) repeat protein
MNRIPALALCLVACACNPGGDGSSKEPASGMKAVPAAGKDAGFEAVTELVKARDHAGAARLLEEMRAERGEDPAVVLRLLDVYHRMGEPARASQPGRAGVAAHPDAHALYPPLAELYMRVPQFDLAKETLLAAREHGVDEKEVAFRLATCEASLGATDTARAEFERARAAGSPPHLIDYNLALLALQDGDRARARKLFETLVAENPGYAPGKRELAHLILDQAILDARASRNVDKKQVDQVMNMLWDIKDELDDDWRVHESMGDGWLLLGDFDASIASYTEALRLGPNPKSVEERYRAAVTLKREADARKAGADPAAGGGTEGGGAPR